MSLIGHDDTINKLVGWLKNFKDDMSTPSACIITGSTGIGKTCLVREVISHTDYQLVEITPDDMPSKTEAKQFLYQHLHMNDIQLLFQGKKKKVAFMIDEIENLGFTHKACLMEFLQYVYPSKKKHHYSLAKKLNIPFFFVGQHSHLKVMQTVLKHSVQIELQAATREEQRILIKNIIDKDLVDIKTDFHHDDNAIDLLIDHCHDDIRQLKILTTELFKFRKLKKINGKGLTINELQRWLNKFEMIANEPDLMRSTLQLLGSPIKLENAIEIYDTDRYLIPLMIHENIPLLRKENGISEITFRKLLDVLIDFDRIDSFMYQNQYWKLQELCGILICGTTSTLIHSNDTNIDIEKCYFTRHLNKVSLQTVKRNAIQRLQKHTKIKTMNGISYLQQAYNLGLMDMDLSPDDIKILKTFNKVPSSGKSRAAKESQKQLEKVKA